MIRSPGVSRNGPRCTAFPRFSENRRGEGDQMRISAFWTRNDKPTPEMSSVTGRTPAA